MKRQLFIVLLLVTGGLVAAQPAAGKEGRDERRDRTDERRQKREERKERQKDRAEDRKERAEARHERRRERARQLRARYGHLLAEPAVLAELKLHSRRMARLHALSRVAEKEGKTTLLPRIEKLIQKEQARHQRHMDALNARGSGAPSPSASASYGDVR